MTKRIVYFFYNFIKKFIENYEEQGGREATKRRDELNGWSK